MRRMICAMAAVFACFLAIGNAWALTPEAVKRDIQARFPVQVLKIEAATIEGQTVFVVTVMNEPGSYNEAFQVNRLIVDAATGALVSQFRHRASGYDLSGAPRREPGREGTEEPR